MTTKPDGGPAFPALDVEHFPAGYGHAESVEVIGRVGMSLRDYFAGHALAHQDIRFVAKVYSKAKGQPNVVEIPPFEWDESTRRAVAEWMARDAYAIADAMIAARERA